MDYADFGIVGGQWQPERSGNYGTDCAMGRRYAENMLEHVAGTQDALVFGTIIRGMVAGGTYEGVEIGFCSRINIVLAGISAASQA